MLLHALFATFRPESSLVYAYRAKKDQSPGLALALRYASREKSTARLPVILVYQDSLPAARITKSLFGSGTVMLSQGLLSSFRDDEVVAVMRRCLELFSQRGVSIKTLCSAWLLELERSHRKPWTPLRAVVLWSLLPLKGFLKRQDLKLDAFRSTQANEGTEHLVWRNALRKVSSSERIFS